MDSALGQNESEFGILVRSALLQVLSDVNSLFDQMVQVFGDLWCEAALLQDSEDFATGDAFNLRDSVAISKSHTDLGRRTALFGKLVNLVNEVVGGNLDPAGRSFSVWEASASDTFAL